MGYSTETAAVYGVELSLDEAELVYPLMVAKYGEADLSCPGVGQVGMWADEADSRCHDMSFDLDLETHTVGILVADDLSWKEAQKRAAEFAQAPSERQALFAEELAPLLAKAGVTRSPEVVFVTQTI